MHIASVVGARPNFMKLAPLNRVLHDRGVTHTVVHTGQHYDRKMSDTFFDDLRIPEPHVNLGVGSASHAQQTARIMEAFEPVCLERQPDVVLVYGDVNSTIAAALVAAKLGITVGHVEAGLRSGDWTMPEEINRVVTDRLSDLLFTPSRDGTENLRSEGVPDDRIHFVGNIMIDSLEYVLPRAKALPTLSELALERHEYVVVTLHRPSNVDVRANLVTLLEALETIAEEVPVIFPVHPRTAARMEEFGIHPSATGLRLLDPVGYMQMLSLVEGAGLVLTDSGGLQEETTYLGVPCLTVRENTERPITLAEGTNALVRPVDVVPASRAALSRGRGSVPRIEKWDGRSAERIADVLDSA